MAKHVFIFGAGASAPFGAPTMATFLDIAQKLFPPSSTEEVAKSFLNVFNAISSLQVVHSKAEFDLVNLESVFTSLELAKTLQRFPSRKAEELDQLIVDLKKVIIVTLERCLQFPITDRGVSAPRPYKEFFTHISKDPSSSFAVLTFNYDIAVDMAFLTSGIGVDYGLEKEPEIHTHTPLLKLHGSLNWGMEVESGRIVPWFLRHYFNTMGGQATYGRPEAKIPIGSQISRYTEKSSNKKEIHQVPVIIPPSWNKADSHRAISNVWSRAAEELAEADSIYVVGYSLPNTDAFFRHLYALGTVGSVLLKRFWVYNPDPTREQVFRDLLGPGAKSRFQFFKMNLEEAFEHIAEAVSGSKQ